MSNIRPQELLILLVIMAILLASAGFVAWLAVMLARRSSGATGAESQPPQTMARPAGSSVCGQCQSPVQPIDRFCGQCGAAQQPMRS